MVHLDLRRESLKESEGDVAVEEGEPLEEEGARPRDSEVVGAPVLESVPREPFEHIEPFSGGDVPVPEAIAGFGLED